MSHLQPMKPGEKKPMPAGIEDLAAALVARVREYERNCRCPKCHGHMASGRSGPLQCVDCDFCLANLRKLMLGELGGSIFFPELGSGSKPAGGKRRFCLRAGTDRR